MDDGTKPRPSIPDTITDASLPDPGPIPYRPRRQLSRDELAALKPVIERLYIEERKKFPQVREFLANNYNFEPTKRQFDVMILKWGLKKNTKFRERKLILDKLSQEENLAVTEKGRIGTVVLSREKLKRWKKEESNKVPPPVTVTKNLQQSLSPRTFSPSSVATMTLSPQPKTPPVYYMPEKLFASIETYFDGSFQSKAWVCNSNSELISTVRSEHIPDHDFADQFFSYCHSAISLVQAGSAGALIEARKALSNACSLVRIIIEAQRPNTLMYFIITYISFRRERVEMLDKAWDLIRSYIARMAATVIRTDHPWRDICLIMGSLDSDQLEEAMVKAMLAMLRVNEKRLGHFHQETISVLQEYIALKHGDDLVSTEKEYRILIDDIERTIGNSPQLLQIMGLLTMNLRQQTRLLEAEAVAIDLFNRTMITETAATHDIIKAYAYLAIAQYRLGKQAEAEYNMREAARLDLTNNYSSEDGRVWAAGRLSMLEGWMRVWGRHDDADKLRAEIDGMIEEPADVVEEVDAL